MKVRHPEKINTSDKLSPLKPNWLKVRFKSGDNIDQLKKLLKTTKFIQFVKKLIVQI